MSDPLYIPQVPTELSKLDRAIALLGERAKGLELRSSKQIELAQLLGRYPDAETAAAWKSSLKKQRANHQAPEHDQHSEAS